MCHLIQAFSSLMVILVLYIMHARRYKPLKYDMFSCYNIRLQNMKMHPKANGEIGTGDLKGICC